MACPCIGASDTEIERARPVRGAVGAVVDAAGVAAGAGAVTETVVVDFAPRIVAKLRDLESETVLDAVPWSSGCRNSIPPDDPRGLLSSDTDRSPGDFRDRPSASTWGEGCTGGCEGCCNSLTLLTTLSRRARVASMSACNSADTTLAPLSSPRASYVSAKLLMAARRG